MSFFKTNFSIWKPDYVFFSHFEHAFLSNISHIWCTLVFNEMFLKKWPILRNLTFYMPLCSKKLIVHCLVGVLTHARKAKPSLTANNINTSACNNAHWWILKDSFLIFLKVCWSNFLINKICQVSKCLLVWVLISKTSKNIYFSIPYKHHNNLGSEKSKPTFSG